MGLGPPFVIVVGMLVMTPWITIPSVIFGVRVPPDHLQDPMIGRLRRRYVLRTAGLALVAAAGSVATTAESSVALATAALLGVLLIGGFLNVAWAHRVLSTAKYAGQWMRGHRAATIANLESGRVSGHPSTLSAIAGGIVVVTLVVGLIRYPTLPAHIPMHFTASGVPNRWVRKSPWVLIGVLLPTTLGATVLTVFARWLPRARQDLDPHQPGTSVRQQWVFVRRTRFLLEGAAVAVTMVGMVGSLAAWGGIQGWGLAAFFWLPIAVILGITAMVALRTGQQGSRLQDVREPPTTRIHRDDDRHWWGGQVYIHRDDPAWIVPRRFGYGYTVNWGHPASCLALIGLLVVVGLGWLSR